MADPLTWMAIASAVGAVGSYSAGRTQEKAAGHQAKLMEQNAAIERQNAVTASQIANEKEDQQRRAARQALGSQAAAQAQAGVGLGGSTRDIAEQSAIAAEMDALGIRYEGEMTRRAHMLRADDLEANAKITRYQGRAARRAGNLSAGVGLLMAGAYGYGAAGGFKPAGPSMTSGTMSGLGGGSASYANLGGGSPAYSGLYVR
jgi:hypothetical protein